ncbi:MAG: hypothetical protein A2176_15780 [Spirochaetes bacterium RBG_13_51_14]|nr:MAG: hypothetical protein A2176_15780 [Spirochaetes bacterium RBG_13_51_14]
MKFLNQFRITGRYSRLRLDRFLSMRYGYLSRSEWQKEISRGKISYNGHVVTKCNKTINAGDVISYAGRDAAEPDVDEGYAIVYEDEYLLGIDKPGNLPVHPAGVFYHNTLLSFLQERLRMKLHLLHRLDRETSGIIVLAKDARVASQIHANFDSAEKTYLALVRGVPHHNDFMVDMPIDADDSSVIEHKRVARHDARKEARTRFFRMLSFNGFSLLKAVPYIGRQHQIRVHLKHAGLPIVGDKLYGADESLYSEFIDTGPTPELIRRLGFRRSALHSRSMLFYHPALKKKICLKAPLPEDMRQFIIQGRGYHV